MANTLQFDLVSPERRLASFAATEVQIPGADGDLTATAGGGIASTATLTAVTGDTTVERARFSLATSSDALAWSSVASATRMVFSAFSLASSEA